MLFSFLKYVKPIWYLNGQSEASHYFIDYRRLSDGERQLIDYCSRYTEESASLMDAALQGWYKGFIEKNGSRCLSELRCCSNVFDNYLFLRRFFSPFWSWYTLFLRLCSLHNPIREFRAFLAATSVRRLDLFKSTKQYPDLDERLNSERDQFVTVVIPTLNRYKYLADVLRDLEKQEHRRFEVIVVDQSDNYQPEFYRQFTLNLHVIRQREKALWKARNDAIRRAKGNLILLFDDDSRVDPDWIARHVKCVNYFGADLSSGVSLSAVGAKIPRTYSYYKWSDQVDTGNVMIRKAVFDRVGLFDRQFEGQRMGDAEFGLRCHLYGLRNVSNPDAKRIHLKVPEGGLREMGSWDAFRPKRIFGPRPVPSVLYYFRKYFGFKLACLALLRDIPLSTVPYRLKGRKSLVAIGAIASLFILPLTVIQMALSWRQATIKLREGARIESLEKMVTRSGESGL